MVFSVHFVLVLNRSSMFTLFVLMIRFYVKIVQKEIYWLWRTASTPRIVCRVKTNSRLQNDNELIIQVHNMHIRLGPVQNMEMDRGTSAPKWQHIRHNSHKIYHVMNLWRTGTSLPSSISRFSRPTVSYFTPCILLTISSRLFLFLASSQWAFAFIRESIRETRSRVLDVFSQIMWQVYGEAQYTYAH